MRLQDKTAIVTGSSRGIGWAITLAMAKERSRVVVIVQNKEVEAVAEEIYSFGKEALTIMADVTKELDAQRLADDTLQAFGSIDSLVNNAEGGSPEF
jgi:NAD(P)-dependent dehydrogenase (short-subunit alcohol dehydrogenase family)